MATVRHSVTQKLANGDLSSQDPLTAVKGIGPFLASNLARAMKTRGEDVTIGQFWAATRRRRNVEKWLHRALQNERGNQCVNRSPRGRSTYHTGDINTLAYEACVALLDFARDGSEAYGALPPRLPPRSAAGQRCGCKETCDGPCVLTSDGLCVPKAHNARGFVGVFPHPSQSVLASDDASRASVRRNANSRNARSARRDRSSSTDVRLGHSRRMRYSRRGGRMWRHPSPKVRLPLLA